MKFNYTKSDAATPAEFKMKCLSISFLWPRRILQLGVVFCTLNTALAVETVIDDNRRQDGYTVKQLDNVIRPIHFSFGKADISDYQIEAINNTLKELKGKRNLRLKIVGHTDNVRVARPSTIRRYGDNYGLSAARAWQVAGLLRKNLNVPRMEINISGVADDEPVASNDTAQGRAKNRRVEVRIEYDVPVTYPELYYHVEEYFKDGPVEVSEVEPLNHIWLAQAPATRKPRMALQAQEKLLLEGGQLSAPLMVQVETNFGNFIDHWSLEIYAADDLSQRKALTIIKGEGSPIMGQTIDWDGEDSARSLSGIHGLSYRMRVFDQNGREAVTRIRTSDLIRKAELLDQRPSLNDEETWYEVLAQRNDLEENRFDLPGGLVTIHANTLPLGGSFNVGGDAYPISANGSIQVERQMAPGDYQIPIMVFDEKGDKIIETTLATKVPSDYFFMMALADLTVGKNKVNGNVELLKADVHFDENVFVDGRLAFYLKGKIKGEYLLTAQMDTGENDIDKIFTDIGRRDPRRLFKRIDPDRYYPVYGDDSTVTRDVDTQGKFYIRLDRDQSTLLWGNYNSSFSGTELANFNRSLYGAKVDLRSGEVTEFGDEKSALKVFASEPDTAAAHDELLGTGGSLYYLSHQDLVLGSARLSVEVRDRDSDRTLDKFDLLEGRDYELDEFQGRVILRRPLRGTASLSLLSIIRDEPLDGDDVILLVDYEYVPKATGKDKRLTAGARGKHWFNKNIGLGGTYIQEQNGNVDFRNQAIDLTLKASDKTYVNVEYAQTKASQNIAFRRSTDGGVSFINEGRVDPSASGNGIAINAQIDLAEYSSVKGTAGAWYRDLDGRFDSLRYNDATIKDRTSTGIEGQVQASENLSLSFRYSSDEVGDLKNEKLGVQIDYKINDVLVLSGEYQRRDEATRNSGPAVEGDADTIALRLQYQANERLSGFVTFQQQDAELNVQENNQYGIGFDFSASANLRVNGEYFDGTIGDGVRIGADYRLSENNTTYLDYTSTSQSRSKRGLTLGQRSQLSDKLSVYQEHRFDTNNSDQRRGNSYGLNYAFNTGWSVDFEMFNGSVARAGTTLDSRAYSVTSRWRQSDLEVVNKFEYREDENALTKNNQWVTTNRFSAVLDEEWSILGRLDYSETESEYSNIRLARFAEVDLGFAYRPIFDDRLNIIGTYAYLFDLDPLQQFGSSQFDERSHVLSLEALFDLSKHFSLGSKIAYKKSELRIARDQGKFFDANTVLGVLRLRYHLVSNWDALLQFRRLAVSQAEDDRQGYLAALERHLGDNVKLGVGYNFTDFNDNLTALDFESRGWFINLLYKR